MNQNYEDYKWAATLLRVVYVFTSILCLMFIINCEWTPSIVFGFLTLIIILMCNVIKNKNKNFSEKLTNIFENLASNDNKTINNITIGNNTIKDHFKFKNHFEEAVIEYSNIFNKNINKLNKDDYDKIYEYSKMHFAYFLLWLIDRKIVNEKFFEEYSYGLVNNVANHKISPLELLKKINYSIFTDDELFKNNDCYFVNYILYRDYYKDYLTEVTKFDNKLYCNDFSYEIYNSIAKIIDNRYLYYVGKSSDFRYEYEYDEIRENVREKIFIPLFGQELEVIADSEVSLEYYNRCIQHLHNLPEKLCNKIVLKLHDYLSNWNQDSEFDGIKDNTMIFKQIFENGRIFIYNPIKHKMIEDTPAFSIDFSDGAEGFEYIVIGNYLVNYKYNDEYEGSIWSIENVNTYNAMKQIDNNEMTKVILHKKDGSDFSCLIPNCVFAQIKNDERVLKIKKDLGIISNYYYSANYFNNGDLHCINVIILKNDVIINSLVYPGYIHI